MLARLKTYGYAVEKNGTDDWTYYHVEAHDEAGKCEITEIVAGSPEYHIRGGWKVHGQKYLAVIVPNHQV